jgi:hypothetical protein
MARGSVRASSGAPDGGSMIDQRHPGLARPDDDVSMRWVERALALIALAVGVLLAVVR